MSYKYNIAQKVDAIQQRPQTSEEVAFASHVVSNISLHLMGIML